MRDQVKFRMIRTDEELSSLTAFAQSFDHHVGRDSIRPIYTIERGQNVIGYANILTFPVVAPALHPNSCTPRDFHEAITAMKNYFCFASISPQFPNGTCFMALPTKEVIDDSVFEKCGFKNTNKEIWQAVP